ncbi:hypothetical protein [Ascidiimonas sp. W6]|uniref:hypothetical protein n=1 Tax=Ascidiimonas meishanensis TaxID=3128903 RepID=UPI0030EE8A98
MNKYVHGYSEMEANRLNDQANSLASLLHYDSIWDEDSLILEAGCGVGAQTKTVAAQNPKSKFIPLSNTSSFISPFKTAMGGETFCYTFFKGIGIKK